MAAIFGGGWERGGFILQISVNVLYLCLYVKDIETFVLTLQCFRLDIQTYRCTVNSSKHSGDHTCLLPS